MPATRFVAIDPGPADPAPIAAQIPTLATQRLVLTPFRPGDAPALAAILRAPEVAKGILANGATPARARATATRRIAWHNATWSSHGYGIWAVRRAAFADTMRMLTNRITIFTSLPVSSLDRMSLQARLDAIGRS